MKNDLSKTELYRIAEIHMQDAYWDCRKKLIGIIGTIENPHPSNLSGAAGWQATDFYPLKVFSFSGNLLRNLLIHGSFFFLAAKFEKMKNQEKKIK